MVYSFFIFSSLQEDNQSSLLNGLMGSYWNSIEASTVSSSLQKKRAEISSLWSVCIKSRKVLKSSITSRIYSPNPFYQLNFLSSEKECKKLNRFCRKQLKANPVHFVSTIFFIFFQALFPKLFEYLDTQPKSEKFSMGVI